jgi:hypothetical protein
MFIVAEMLAYPKKSPMASVCRLFSIRKAFADKPFRHTIRLVGK